MSFLTKNPLVSHGVLALVDVMILTLGFFHPLLGALGAVWAASLVSVFFYGREAGQLEHDFKRDGVSPVKAWARATFLYGWPWTNIVQWLVPTFMAVAGAIAFVLSKKIQAG